MSGVKHLTWPKPDVKSERKGINMERITDGPPVTNSILLLSYRPNPSEIDTKPNQVITPPLLDTLACNVWKNFVETGFESRLRNQSVLPESLLLPEQA